LPLLRARRPSHPPSSGRHDRTPGPPSAPIQFTSYARETGYH
jgi:hypothetical protein